MADNLRLCFEHIKTRLDALRLFLADHPPRYACLHTLGDISREEERSKHVERIPVSVHRNIGADRLLAALQDFGTDRSPSENGVSTKITRKYPGLVVLAPEHAGQLRMLINHINQAKEEFSAELARTGSNHYQRFDVLHQRLPGVITLQVTRQILFCCRPVYRASFYWHSTTQTYRISKEEAIEKLESRKARMEKGVFISSEQAIKALGELEDDIEAVRAITLGKGEELRLQRKSAVPVPAAHLATSMREKNGMLLPVYENFKASLPVFAVGDVPEKVAFLPDYPAEGRIKRTPARYVTIPVVDRIGLVKICLPE